MRWYIYTYTCEFIKKEKTKIFGRCYDRQWIIYEFTEFE